MDPKQEVERLVTYQRNAFNLQEYKQPCFEHFPVCLKHFRLILDLLWIISVISVIDQLQHPEVKKL